MKVYQKRASGSFSAIFDRSIAGRQLGSHCSEIRCECWQRSSSPTRRKLTEGHSSRSRCETCPSGFGQFRLSVFEPGHPQGVKNLEDADVRSWRSPSVAGPTGKGSKESDMTRSPNRLAMPAVCAKRPLRTAGLQALGWGWKPEGQSVALLAAVLRDEVGHPAQIHLEFVPRAEHRCPCVNACQAGKKQCLAGTLAPLGTQGVRRKAASVALASLQRRRVSCPASSSRASATA
jgi:hypothetical protein